MILHQNVYLPDGETHLQSWMDKSGEIVDGRGTYQIRKLRAATRFCKQKRTAIDVGGHCGLWSMQLAKMFTFVHAFEPVARHRECFEANLVDAKNVTLHACALGERAGSICIKTDPHSSGDSRVGGDGDIPLRMLDEYDFEEVDFMKLDAEGYELFALRGGEKLIRRCLPVIIVEQKPGKAQQFGLPERGAVDYLKGLGYTQTDNLSGDFVMVAN